MMKIGILRLFLALLLTLSFFGFAVATTTVVSPNGGEFVSGTYPITWTASDAGDTQSIDFNLYYSLISGANSHSITQTDLNSCDVGTEIFWANSDVNYADELPNPVRGTDYVTGISSFQYGGKSYVSMATTTMTGSDRNITGLDTYYWNEETSEFVDDSANFDLDTNNMVCTEVDGGCSFTTFNIGNTYYMISTNSSNAAGSNNTIKPQGWKLNSGVWEEYPAIVADIVGTDFDYSNTAVFEINPVTTLRIDDILFLITYEYSQRRSWYWNGTNWIGFSGMDQFNTDDPFCLPPDCPTEFFSMIPYPGFRDANDLIVIGRNAFDGVTSAYIYEYGGDMWELQYDNNQNLYSTTSKSNQPVGMATIDDAGVFPIVLGRLLLSDYVASTFGFIESKDYDEQLNTSDTFNCSYSWDTKTAENGKWYLDIESNAGDDSSNSWFVLSNFSSSELVITPIKNVDSVSYDANGARLTSGGVPDEMIWKATNNHLLEITPRYLLNGFIDSDKIAFVYSSNDGENWVFDDTLTYGSTIYDPVQKIWDANNLRYDFSFIERLGIGEERYYRVKFADVPFSAIQLKDNPNWVTIPIPNTYSEGDYSNHSYDLFNDSNYTNLLIYTEQRFSELFSSDLNVGYELQFTAFADTSGTIKVGYRVGGTDTTTDVIIIPGKRRYSIPINTNNFDAQLLVKSTNTVSNRYYFSDWAIVPRSYFASRLEIFNADWSVLKAILVNGESHQYLKEGLPFVFTTSVFNKDSDLSFLYIDVNIGDKTIKSFSFNLKDQSEIMQFSEVIKDVIDANGTATDPEDLRDITITATLKNRANQTVAEQFKQIKLLQYPFSAADFDLVVGILNKKVGENPQLNVRLSQTDPDQLIGLKIIIYDENGSINNSDFNTVIYNTDLGCNSISCSKRINIDEWVWEAASPYTVIVLALLKTEYENYDNPITLSRRVVLVTYRDWDTARIFQVFERTDRTYRNDEPIPLLIQLRDVPYRSLKDDVTAYLTVNDCSDDTFSDCNVGTFKFMPISFIYDKTTGYNYFYFNDVLFRDNGQLFDDGDYLEILANIQDMRGSHQASISPALADKCAANYGSLFLNGWFNMNYLNALLTSAERALYGCGTLSSSTVYDGDGEQQAILIDEDHDVNSELNHSVFCVGLDNEFRYLDNLKQDLLCYVWYRNNEQSIDSFDVYVGNKYSDYSKKDGDKQYISFRIPAEEVIFNDPILLMKALQTEYQTDQINTIGEFTFYMTDSLYSGVLNPISDILEGTARTGILGNIGFDLNFDKSLDPTYLTGVFAVKIKGLQVINQYDYIPLDEEFILLDPEDFLTYVQLKGYYVPIDKTTVEIFGGDMDRLEAFEVDSALIINEDPTATVVNPANVPEDVNLQTTSIPRQLKFDYIMDMVFNNERNSNRLVVPLIFNYVVPISTGLPPFINSAIEWSINNWFLLFIVFATVFLLTLMYRNINSGGGKLTLNLQRFRPPSQEA